MPIHQTARTFGARRVPTSSAASGCWQLGEVTQARRAGIWPIASDPFFSSVSLLLPMDGTNGSTTFTDESSNAFTVTSANVEISSEQSKFGGTSVKFLSTSGYLSLAEQSEFVFNTGDFTIEFWIRGTNFASNPNIYDTRPAGSSAAGSMAVYIWFNKLRWQTNVVIDSTVTPSNNVWYHVALTRQSGTSRMFIDGVLQNSFSDTNNYNVSRGPIIGNGWTLNGTGLTGYIDDFRITKGVARYTAAFTPPAAPHPTS